MRLPLKLQTTQTFWEPKLTFSKIHFSVESRHCFAGYTHKLTEQVAARARRSEGAERERERFFDWLTDWTLLHKDKGLGTNACHSTCHWNCYKHLYIYIYMIIVGKSMPIDNYEQYSRVINQITGRLYMHIYILETKKLFD